jgi:transposase-like protein
MNGTNGNHPRRQLTAELKAQAIREARHGGVPISQVCDKYGIHPGQFYQWEKTAERAMIEALQGQKRGRKKMRPREEELLAEIERLREVVAEITTENLALKKGRWR